MSILGSSDLYVKEEATVWSAMKIWLMANQKCESKLVHGMLNQVRLHLLSPEFINEEVLTFDLISSNAQCRALINKKRKRKTKRKRKISKDKMMPENLDDDEVLNRRMCSHLENEIYILTSWAREIENDCHGYHDSYSTVRFDPDSEVIP